MTEDLNRFALVGARFNKLLIDESALRNSEVELTVQVQRKEPVISEHRYGDRLVIEFVVRAKIVVPDNEDAVVDIECTGGFVPVDEALDGDLESFKQHSDFYGRALYWVLRSRLQTLLATTRFQWTPLAWDIVDPSVQTENSKEAATKSKKVVKSKNVKK